MCTFFEMFDGRTLCFKHAPRLSDCGKMVDEHEQPVDYKAGYVWDGKEYVQNLSTSVPIQRELKEGAFLLLIGEEFFPVKRMTITAR